MSKDNTPKDITRIRYSDQEMRSISGDEWILSESMEAHWHSFIEIDIVTDGEGEQIINGERVKLERGVITIIRPTDWHSINVISPIGFTHVAFDERLLSSEIREALFRYANNLYFQSGY